MSEFRKIFSGEDVSISDLIKKFGWVKVKFKTYSIVFLISLIVFLSVGILAKKTSPLEFESKCILLDEQSAESGIANSITGGVMNVLSPLAASSKTGGVNSSGLALYNLILSNKPFLLELAKKKIIYSASCDTTLFEYFWEDPKDDLVSEFIGKLKLSSTSSKRIFNKKYLIPSNEDIDSISFTRNISVSNLSTEEKRIISILSKKIKIEQTGNLITLTVKIPDQVLSAQVTRSVLSQLIKYATQIKVGKQIDNVRFLEKRVADAELKYSNAQMNLANFQDYNQDLIYESLRSRSEKLKNDFTLYAGVYNQLVSQLEQAKIQLKKDMPIFTVVEPIYLPEAPIRSNEKIFYYLRIGVILAFILCCLHAVNYRYKILRKISQTVNSKFIK